MFADFRGNQNDFNEYLEMHFDDKLMCGKYLVFYTLHIFSPFDIAPYRISHRISYIDIMLIYVCRGGYGNLSTLSISITRLAFGRTKYCDAACG